MEVAKIYAIIETGGKQYKVEPGQTIEVDRLSAAEGETVSLDRVLMVANGDMVTTGNPVIEGASVTATCQGEGRKAKIIVLKYKPKTRYRKKTGHRQHFSKLTINEIIASGAPGEAIAKPKTRTRRIKKEVTENGS